MATAKTKQDRPATVAKEPTAAERKAMERAQAAKRKEEEALAKKIAKLRSEGAPWDGDKPNAIVSQLKLCRSATTGRALLRRYHLSADTGGSVRIAPSYDREAKKAAKETPAAKTGK
jgi:hypothetical protein